MINLVSEDANEIMNQFSYQVNNLCFKVRKTAEEYKDAELMKDLDLCWIRVLSNPDYRFDLRNEASSIVGKKIATIPFVAKILEYPNNSKMEAVAQKMAREHRSIQQLFTKLTFYHFSLTCTTNEYKILTDALGDDFYMLPFI